MTLTSTHIARKLIALCLAILLLSLLPFSPLRPMTTRAAGDGFWYTSGSQLKDAAGNNVRITGINWFGFETNTFAPHGLNKKGYKTILDRIKELGYNSIRLPYSNEMFLKTSSAVSGIDFNLTGNSDLQNKSPLEIMDRLIDYAGDIGLKIILDRHRARNSDSTPNPYWYTTTSKDATACHGCNPPTFNEADWIADWEMLANRYKAGSSVVTALGITPSTIIAADIHNEPHDSACWGCSDANYNWKGAAQRAGNAILAIQPGWLIIVEGVQHKNDNTDFYWWGGNLAEFGASSISFSVGGNTVSNKLVYSAHDYPLSIWYQTWFDDPNFPCNMSGTGGVWDNHWGYLHRTGVAPVLLGELGSPMKPWTNPNGSPTASGDGMKDMQWMLKLIEYLGTSVTGISWTYWSYNPDSGDTGGMVVDSDWVTLDYANVDQKTVNQCGTQTTLGPYRNSKDSYFSAIKFALTAGGGGDTQAPTTPSSLTSPSKTSSSVSLSWTASTDNVGVAGYEVFVNGSSTPSVTTTGTGTTATVSGLSASTAYSFTVKARDAAGNRSAASSALSVTSNASDTQAPTSPSSLTSPSKTDTSVSLSWTASTDNVGVAGYEVFVNGSSTPSVTTTGTGTTATVSSLTASTAYSFTVKARDAAGNRSAASSALSVTTNAASGSCNSTNATLITVGFTYDGSGTFCWKISSLGYINSWNTTSVTVNGANWTNLYATASQLPAQSGGYWYIAYSSTVSYAHFEAKP